MLRLFLRFAMLSICFVAVAQAEQSQEPLAVESVRIGFGGAYKLGCWTPVEITLNRSPGQGSVANQGGVRLQALDSDSVPARFAATATTGSRVFTYAKIGRGEGPIEVLARRASDDATGLAWQSLRTLSPGELAKPLPATNEFFVELGGSIGLSEMARRAKQDENDPGRTVVVTLDQPLHLPDKWYGYEGVDLLAISGTKEVKQFFADPRSAAALEHWVRLGGVVLIATAAEADSLLGKGKSLERFAPGEYAEMATLPLRGIASIERFAGAEGTEERLNADRMRVPLWRDVQGDAVLGMGDRSSEFPLVVRRSMGFGEVVFVGLDLDDPAFAEWPSRPHFLESVLGRRSKRSGDGISPLDTGRGRHLGFVDLSGQMRGALDQFDDVLLIPFWAIAMLALGYVGCLFPLNYWLATRWFKRPQLAWLTFVFVAGAFSGGVYYFARQAKGDRLRLNQIDLVDFDVESNSARGTTWFNLFSPSNAKFDLEVRPDLSAIEGGRRKGEGGSDPASPDTSPPDTRRSGPRHSDPQTPSQPELQSLVSWLGLPGPGLGGMNSPAAGVPLFEEPYEIEVGQGTEVGQGPTAGQGRVAGAPIGIWSSKAFVARWQAPASGGLEADLTVAGGRLRGEISNHMNIPLEQCVILFENMAWPIGKFGAGATIRVESIDPQVSQTIESYLTKRQLYSLKEQVPPYDRAGFDVPRILEVMMFHQQSGGTNYTGLLHRFQRYVDLSSQLALGKAIVVGRAAAGAEIQIDGEPVPSAAINRHTTVYRYVLPVKTK